jgi:hypothetical protein
VAVSDRIDASPRDRSLRKQRAALLDQVRLNEAAEFNLKGARSSRKARTGAVLSLASPQPQKGISLWRARRSRTRSTGSRSRAKSRDSRP